MTKTCNICGVCKNVDEFDKKGKGYQYSCKCCQKINQHKWYLKNKDKCYQRKVKAQQVVKQWLMEYKQTLSCSVCGEHRWYVLDFHHKDKKTKEDNIGTLINRGWVVDRIKSEIDKCDVLCSNCHRELHHLERNIA